MKLEAEMFRAFLFVKIVGKSNTIFFLKPDTKFIDIMAIKGFRMCEYTQ